MSQRTALIIAGSITAFILVLIGGIAVTLASRSSTLAQTATQPTSGAPMAAPTVSFVHLAPDQVAQIALNLVPGAQLAQTPGLVNFQGTVAYEVVLDQGTVYVDANSGKILLNNTTVSSPFGGEGGEGRSSREGGHDD